jgi:hypothetical protein
MSYVSQLWEDIDRLRLEYWELYKQVEALEEEAYRRDIITEDTLNQFKKIYVEMGEIRSKKLDILQTIYEANL